MDYNYFTITISPEEAEKMRKQYNWDYGNRVNRSYFLGFYTNNH